MKRKIVLIIMLITCVMLQAISLDESIELARKNNKELLAENYNVLASNWATKNALTNFLPKITFNSTTVRIDDKTYEQANDIFQIPVLNSGIPTGDYVPFSASVLSGGFYKTTFTNDVTIQQPIFNGGKLLLGYQMTKLAEKQAKVILIDKQKNTDLNVAATYFGILKLNDLKTLSQKSLNSTISHLDAVLKKYGVGSAKKSDVLQWKVKLKNDETTLTEIENNLRELTAYWKNLLGKPDAELPDSVNLQKYDAEIERYTAMNDVEMEEEIKSFLTEVKTSSPALQTLNITRKLMQKNYLLAKGGFLPSLNLQFSYQIESDDKLDFAGEDNWSMAAVFSFPLFHSGKNYSNLRKAEYELKKTNFQTEWATDNYLVSAENTLRKLITNAKIVTDNKISLEFAKENHKIINEYFNQGLVTNSELLDAEAMLFAGEMNLVAAYYDFILAKYEMKKHINLASDR